MEMVGNKSVGGNARGSELCAGVAFGSHVHQALLSTRGIRGYHTSVSEYAGS